MKCLRCGYCCLNSLVVVVDDPDLGPVEGNLKAIGLKGPERCPHLLGNKIGEYSCAVHDRPWYKETPCHAHGQVEGTADAECRIGAYFLKRE